MPRYFILLAIAVVIAFVLYGFLRAVLGPEIMAVLSLIALIVIAVIVFRNMRTNRKVAEATPEQRAQALTFTPDSAKAALYVFRNQFVGRAAGVNVIIDGCETAQIKSPRFTRILLTPGAHRIAGYTGTNKAPSPDEGLAFSAAAGEVIVMKCEVEPQLVGVTVKFTPLALDAARADVAKITRMVAPDVPEV